MSHEMTEPMDEFNLVFLDLASGDQVKEVGSVASSALTLEEKLQGQKQVKARETHRKERHRHLFDIQDEIGNNRERLIASTEGKLKSESSEEELFTIRWSLE